MTRSKENSLVNNAEENSQLRAVRPSGWVGIVRSQENALMKTEPPVVHLEPLVFLADH